MAKIAKIKLTPLHTENLSPTAPKTPNIGRPNGPHGVKVHQSGPTPVFHTGNTVRRKTDKAEFVVERVTPYGLKLKDQNGWFASLGFTIVD